MNETNTCLGPHKGHSPAEKNATLFQYRVLRANTGKSEVLWDLLPGESDNLRILTTLDDVKSS